MHCILLDVHDLHYMHIIAPCQRTLIRFPIGTYLAYVHLPQATCALINHRWLSPPSTKLAHTYAYCPGVFWCWIPTWWCITPCLLPKFSSAIINMNSSEDYSAFPIPYLVSKVTFLPLGLLIQVQCIWKMQLMHRGKFWVYITQSEWVCDTFSDSLHHTTLICSMFLQNVPPPSVRVEQPQFFFQFTILLVSVTCFMQNRNYRSNLIIQSMVHLYRWAQTS